MERDARAVLDCDRLAPRQLRAVDVGGREVLLTRLRDGEVVATGVLCPHQAYRLERGTLYYDSADRPQINCALHHYTYDVYTGENLYPGALFPPSRRDELAPLRVYEAFEEDGRIWIGVDGAGRPRLSKRFAGFAEGTAPA